VSNGLVNEYSENVCSGKLQRDYVISDIHGLKNESFDVVPFSYLTQNGTGFFRHLLYPDLRMCLRRSMITGLNLMCDLSVRLEYHHPIIVRSQ